MAVNVFTYTSGLVLLALLVVSVTCRPTLEDTHQGVGISSPEKANVAQARSDSVQPKVPDRPVFILGDVEIPLHRNAIRNKSMHWKDGIVPFVVDNDYPDTARATILAGLHEIETDVESNGTKCIQFIPRTTEQHYLRIKRGTGCHSPIGFDPEEDGAVVSTLGPGCEIKGIVMHEILHVLGFYHEQNRPDRDLYVDINETNVAVIRDFYIRNETIIDTMGIPYDFLSIMHYGAYNSAQVKRYPVITPKPKYGRTLRLGQRVGLSPTDVIKVQTLYNCQLDTSHVHSDMDERVIDRCDFALGMCNFTAENTAANYAAKWVVQTEPTLDGPVAGYTNGLDAFLFASLKDEEAFSSIASKEVSSQATVQPTENLTTLKNEIKLMQATTTRTPHTTTVYSPVLTSGEDGMVCVQYVIYQKGPSSFLQLFLSGPLLQRQELRNYKPLSHDYWARDEVRIDLGRRAEFRLEFVANLLEGSVAIDDYYVVKGECIYSRTPYDFESIMHYGAYDAGKVHRYPVITPKPKYGKTLRLGQRLGLSDIDVMKIQMLYNCPIDTSHIQRGLGDRLIDYCDFAFGICNFNLGNATTGSGPTWVVQNVSTPDGPVGGISNGLDPFLFASKEWDDLSSLTTEDISPQWIRNSTTTDSAATTIAPSAISKTPVTVTIYSPLLTSGDDGRACIQFALFQYGPSSYLDVFVSGPLLQRQRLRTFGDVSRMEFWVRYEIKLDMGTKAEFQLEFVAYLLEGTVSLDDYYVVKGNCIYAD